MYEFICPIFGVSVSVSIDPESAFKSKGAGAVTSTVKSECISDGSNKTAFIIWISDGKNWYYLVHECLHLVRKIFQHVGIPFNSINHELIAYYQTYWVKTIWEGINEIS